MSTQQAKEEPVPPQTPDRGSPESPLELPAEGWKAALKRAMKEFKDDRGTMVGAGMAFFWFLAIFPALLAAVGIAGLIGLSADTVASLSDAIRSAVPGDAARVLTDALTQANEGSGGASIVATVIGVGVALWSASAGFVALQTGLDLVYDVAEDRKYVAKRLRALFLIGVTVVFGGIATAAIVFGAPIGEAVGDNLGFAGGAFVVLWTIARWVVGLAALSTLFAAYYYVAPNRETPRWAWLTPGGALATVIWLLASLGFSFYVNNLGSYGETYGSLTGVVVLLLWLYLSGIAVVLGGEVNAELERQGEHQRRGWFGRNDKPKGDEQPTTRVQAQAAPPPEKTNGQQRETYESSWLEMMQKVREGNR